MQRLKPTRRAPTTTAGTMPGGGSKQPGRRRATLRPALCFVLLACAVVSASAKLDIKTKKGRSPVAKTAGGDVIQLNMPPTTVSALSNALPLPGASIAKYQDPLVLPPIMPQANRPPTVPGSADYYEISIKKKTQQILPAGYNPTTVFAYGPTADPATAATYNYPALTIEAQVRRPVRVKWSNELVDPSNNYVPHILPVDQSLHWANPPGGLANRDTNPCDGVCTYDKVTDTYDCNASGTPCETVARTLYTGPVPMVTHLHGAESPPAWSDGYTEAWYLPKANNIPASYANVGTWYDIFKANASSDARISWTDGSATFEYPNEQRETALWYHDHALGMTRLNVYAGLAGFYFLRQRNPGNPSTRLPLDCPPGGNCKRATLPGPAPGTGPNDQVRELPLAIQDKSFLDDGSLLYPINDLDDNLKLPVGPHAAFAVPEFFGDAMLVNGKTWPFHNVYKSLYRLRLLNGCNSRTLNLYFSKSLDGSSPLPFYIIGNEAGFYSNIPISATEVLMSPAQRYDVIIDFTGLTQGDIIYLLNNGPDIPYSGVSGQPAAHPDTTGQVMQFRVISDTIQSQDTAFSPPTQLRLPTVAPLPSPTTTRNLALLEVADPEDIPIAQFLGKWDPANPLNPGLEMWQDNVAITTQPGSTEEWLLWNPTADAHPMHVHENYAQVVERVPFTVKDDNTVTLGVPAPLPATDGNNFRDTVIAPSGFVTRIRVQFGTKPGLFVWHCHIVEHEDNEMMRPYCIGQPGYYNPKTNAPMCPAFPGSDVN